MICSRARTRRRSVVISVETPKASVGKSSEIYDSGQEPRCHFTTCATPSRQVDKFRLPPSPHRPFHSEIGNIRYQMRTTGTQFAKIATQFTNKMFYLFSFIVVWCNVTHTTATQFCAQHCRVQRNSLERRNAPSVGCASLERGRSHLFQNCSCPNAFFHITAQVSPHTDSISHDAG